MTVRHYRPRHLLAFSLLLIATAGGCGSSNKGKIWVYRYPDFYQRGLERIAVLPFADGARARGTGARISDKVSAILTNNGTYKVYTRQHLADVLKEKDLAAAGVIDSQVAKRIGKLTSVQAIVCGRCNRAETVTRRETRYNRVAVWGTNARGQRVITRWKQVPYKWWRHDGHVECQVHVIDCATGRQIAAVHSPSTFWASGSPPKYTAPDVLRFAEEDQVKRIVNSIAITRTQIKLDGDVLKTAASLYDNEWDWQRRFVPGDGHLYIVVHLPGTADRNNFKLTIVPKDERETLAEKSFRWSKKNRTFGHKFAIKPIVDKRGPGRYQAKLYSGTEPIAWYDFEIIRKR